MTPSGSPRWSARPGHSGPEPATLIFKINRGQFNPVVSDGERIYLVGSGSITALEPRHAQPAVATAKKKKKAQHKKKARAKLRHQKRRLAHTAVVCFKRNGKTHCRHRKPYVCFKSGGHTKCHAVRRKQR